MLAAAYYCVWPGASGCIPEMNSIHQSNMQSKTAIITGSGRGIGRETAILLAEHVANIVVCSRTQSEIDSVVKEIENVNNQVTI